MNMGRKYSKDGRLKKWKNKLQGTRKVLSKFEEKKTRIFRHLIFGESIAIPTIVLPFQQSAVLAMFPIYRMDAFRRGFNFNGENRR